MQYFIVMKNKRNYILMIISLIIIILSTIITFDLIVISLLIYSYLVYNYVYDNKDYLYNILFKSDYDIRYGILIFIIGILVATNLVSVITSIISYILHRIINIEFWYIIFNYSLFGIAISIIGLLLTVKSKKDV